VNKIPLALKVLLGLAIVAVVVVVLMEQRASSHEAGWEALSTAQRAGDTVESLETAAQAARGTDAEPWVDFLLARRLYDAGGKEQLDRARSVAQQALDRHPDSAAAAHLSRVIAAVDSLAQISSG
jgi:hypothetical protein